ncbi:hypothetical protein K492DRAFT_206972 [Lichtheimia hyalospora FSU 10163]|nr:hypothetical protein K492DRAFT_206972 [Lichtheimia hyalospora FSU 10163]
MTFPTESPESPEASSQLGGYDSTWHPICISQPKMNLKLSLFITLALFAITVLSIRPPAKVAEDAPPVQAPDNSLPQAQSQDPAPAPAPVAPKIFNLQTCILACKGPMESVLGCIKDYCAKKQLPPQ